ncbi:uncharacterized protein LOC131658361 [Vicia villosa]|uniref:uncharacterized protein LOC131658361 n=1 Tax=Vicia villosa TaxID=3911 RepID=UPI00273ABA42|nr:uncharacterized protein LOC131658361 [Vicia villosa]
MRQNNDSGKEDWNSLWRIKAPSRTKHLLWRICRGCLPSRIRLRQYQVPCPSDCQLCGNNNEDDWHVFFDCDTTIQCWRTTGLSDLLEPRLHTFSDVKSLIIDICRSEDRMVAGRFAVMMDVIWKNRNDFIWHNEKEEASKLGMIAFHNWQNWLTAQRFQGRENTHQNITSWNPPMEGWLKWNVDAGFNNHFGPTNRGRCVRGKQGNFIIAGVAWDIGTLSILEAEASALKEAIEGPIALHLTILSSKVILNRLFKASTPITMVDLSLV